MAVINQQPTALALTGVQGSPFSLAVAFTFSASVAWASVTGWEVLVTDRYGNAISTGIPTITSAADYEMSVEWTANQTNLIANQQAARYALQVTVASVGPLTLISGPLSFYGASWPNNSGTSNSTSLTVNIGENVLDLYVSLGNGVVQFLAAGANIDIDETNPGVPVVSLATSPALTGIPTAPTAAPLTSTDQIATDAYADAGSQAAATIAINTSEAYTNLVVSAASVGAEAYALSVAKSASVQAVNVSEAYSFGITQAASVSTESYAFGITQAASVGAENYAYGITSAASVATENYAYGITSAASTAAIGVAESYALTQAQAASVQAVTVSEAYSFGITNAASVATEAYAYGITSAASVATENYAYGITSAASIATENYAYGITSAASTAAIVASEAYALTTAQSASVQAVTVAEGYAFGLTQSASTAAVSTSETYAYGITSAASTAAIQTSEAYALSVAQSASVQAVTTADAYAFGLTQSASTAAISTSEAYALATAQAASVQAVTTSEAYALTTAQSASVQAVTVSEAYALTTAQAASVNAAAVSDPRGYASAASTAAIGVSETYAYGITSAASTAAIATSESYAFTTAQNASINAVVVAEANAASIYAPLVSPVFTGTPVVPTDLSISFDSSSLGTLVNPGASITWSHTCSGLNRVLFVMAWGNTGGSGGITGATYAGTAMTLIASIQVPGDRWIYLFGLYAPTLGTNNVVVSASSNIALFGEGSSYSNTIQSGAFTVATTSGAATPATASLAVTVPGSWTVIALKELSGTPAASSVTTQRVNNTGTFIGDSNGPLGAGSTSLGATVSAAWAAIMVAIPSVGGAPAASTTFVETVSAPIVSPALTGTPTAPIPIPLNDSQYAVSTIAFDSSQYGGVATATTLTWSHTCSGNNGYLFVVVVGTNILSVTYNGAEMSQIAYVGPGLSLDVYNIVLYGLALPSSGANNVVVTTLTTNSMWGGSSSYNGVSTGDAIDSSVSLISSVASTSLILPTTSTAPNCWAFGVFSVNNGNLTPTAMMGTTFRSASYPYELNMADSNGPAMAGSRVSLGATFTSGAWSGLIVTFKPSQAAQIATTPYVDSAVSSSTESLSTTYNISGLGTSWLGSGSVGSNIITTTNQHDFKAGQGIQIWGGGTSPSVSYTPAAPSVSAIGLNSASVSYQYCVAGIGNTATNNGVTAAGSVASFFGNTLLSTTNYNVIKWSPTYTPALGGYDAYAIYGRTSASLNPIGTIFVVPPSSFSVALVGSSNKPPYLGASISANTTYKYTLTGIDYWGNESPALCSASVTTGASVYGVNLTWGFGYSAMLPYRYFNIYRANGFMQQAPIGDLGWQDAGLLSPTNKTEPTLLTFFDVGQMAIAGPVGINPNVPLTAASVAIGSSLVTTIEATTSATITIQNSLSNNVASVTVTHDDTRGINSALSALGVVTLPSGYFFVSGAGYVVPAGGALKGIDGPWAEATQVTAVSNPLPPGDMSTICMTSFSGPGGTYGNGSGGKSLRLFWPYQTSGYYSNTVGGGFSLPSSVVPYPPGVAAEQLSIVEYLRDIVDCNSWVAISFIGGGLGDVDHVQTSTLRYCILTSSSEQSFSRIRGDRASTYSAGYDEPTMVDGAAIRGFAGANLMMVNTVGCDAITEVWITTGAAAGGTISNVIDNIWCDDWIAPFVLDSPVSDQYNGGFQVFEHMLSNIYGMRGSNNATITTGITGPPLNNFTNRALIEMVNVRLNGSLLVTGQLELHISNSMIEGRTGQSAAIVCAPGSLSSNPAEILLCVATSSLGVDYGGSIAGIANTTTGTMRVLMDTSSMQNNIALINSGGGTASLNGAMAPVHVDILTPQDGDMVYNSNASLSCGIGVVVYNANANTWKNLYSGNTYTP